MLIRSVTFALVLVGVVLGTAIIQAAPGASDTVVKAKANAGKAASDGKQVIDVELAIDEGWHLYANPVGDPGLIENQVVVTAKSAGKSIDAKVDYPKGIEVKDKGAAPGDPAHREYRGTVTIKVTVDRSKIGQGTVDLVVRVAACDEKTCKFPADIKLTVPEK